MKPYKYVLAAISFLLSFHEELIKAIYIYIYIYVYIHVYTQGGTSRSFIAVLLVTGLIPGLRRPPGEGNDYPLQYSGLEDSIDRGVQEVTVRQD